MTYIKREKVCEICNNKGDDCGKEKCPVYKVPTADVVEVVRCKDCVYRMELSPLYQYEGRSYKVCFVRHKPVSDDGYCNEAIRKEDE